MRERSTRQLIEQMLDEDIGRGDITTSSLIPRDSVSKAVIISEGNGILAGLGFVENIFRYLDAKAIFRSHKRDGASIRNGNKVLYIKGKTRAILNGERTALNLLSRLSGIATVTSEYVKRARPYKAKIMDTRKTTPNLRVFEKYAVRMGGGYNHRMRLYDQVLIKDNHLSAIGNRLSVIREKAVYEAVNRAKMRVGAKVEVEVNNLSELKAALEAGPDIIMLDNMSIKEIRKAVVTRNELRITDYGLRKIPLLEVSGGVTLDKVRRIASTGIERISVGALTTSAKPISFKLDIA